MRSERPVHPLLIGGGHRVGRVQMSSTKTLFSSTAIAVAGTVVVIAVHHSAADLIAGAVALPALAVATRSGIQLAGEDGAADDEPPSADLTPKPRRRVPRP